MQKGARKKIAVVIPKYGLVGGAESHTAELTDRISKNEQFDVHVFANQWTNNSENITFHKVPIITFPKWLTTISFAYFAGIEISHINPDIIHTHERIFSADLCTLHGIPHHIWVKDIRKKKVPSLFDYGTMWVAKKFYNNNKCKKFIAVSNLTKEKLFEEYPHIDHRKVSVIHPGVDIDKFTKLDRQVCRNEVRQQFGITQEEIVVIFVSMNYDIKGLDYLMAGLARFKGKHPKENFKLLIVGRSNNRKYIALAKKIGIDNNVLYTGTIPHDQIAKFYLASDIFCMPSRFDTFGLTVLEAMAASLPVIISTNVGAKDIVKQGVNGFVIDHANHEDSIADALKFMWNEDGRMKMSEEALMTALHHQWEMTVEQYLDVYQQILKVATGPQ